MADETLSRMFDALHEERSGKEAQIADAAEKRRTDMINAGRAMRDRVLSRLKQANEAWSGKASIEIADRSEHYVEGRNSYPELPYMVITVRERTTAHRFLEVFNPAKMAVKRERGPSGARDMNFPICDIEEFKDSDVDELLRVLLREAMRVGS